ncbi:MAG TPA: site-specific DNA-methyltransferase [Thermoanaerobaculia bacterium]|jgi:adenine-specific DNA-methyltransferase|nr:site-specific DNA-methyltransferase [Thermoanaerobaculia bacterium]
MSQKYEKLKKLLMELFQLDQPDLDFGLYRIMHAKSAEVTQFLDDDLLPQVKEAFGQYKSADKAEIEKELSKAIEQAKALDVNAETTPKVRELRARLATDSVDLNALESEVYDHLFSFFRRYYDEGDFLAKRVYKPGVYAIPYEGEEVTLHWANKDQYYIKTSEYLRDYAFRLRPDDKKNPLRVHFRLVDAVEGEHGNIKPAEGKDRVFMLATGGESGHDFIAEEQGEQGKELAIRFEYRPATLSDWPEEVRAGKNKPPTQKELSALSVQRVLSITDVSLGRWIAELQKPQTLSGGEKADYSRLEVHLRRYTARNTFDYFIHKDLGGFLRRELDFYIKNEVMHLDDVENETVARVEQYVSKIKVIRRIANKIIDFLTQLEDFQKKLWLKKKFVVETNYCITLDRISASFYPEIIANAAQRAEWQQLFSVQFPTDTDIDQPETTALLADNPSLVVDTAHFNPDFVVRLVSIVSEIDQQTDGVLIHSDNFHALDLLQARLRRQVKCIYVDPPYNTSSSAIPYKNNYQHSSWGTMMRDRLELAAELLKTDGAVFVSIDKTERTILEYALDTVFGSDNHIEELIWTQGTANGQLPNYATNHEYVEVYARDRRAVESDAQMFREPKPGFAEVIALVDELQKDYVPSGEVQARIRQLYDEHIALFRSEWEGRGGTWDADAKRQDPWRGIYPYNRAEYRDAAGRLVPDTQAAALKGSLWVWSEIPTSAPASKQSPTTKDPSHFNFRYYRPLHPVTQKPCPHPKSGWKFPYKPDPKSADRRSFTELDADARIVWGEDESKVARTKGFLHEVETNIGTSVFYAYNDGEAELSDLFGESGLFLSPKSSRFVMKFIAQTARKDDWVVDFFGGSGSTGHAVISQNREDSGRRKHVLVEVGRHFDSLLLPRIKKACFSGIWRDGKPAPSAGGSHFIKYIRLESYEDALNNLETRRTDDQQRLLESADSKVADGLKEQYLLRYMLNVETQGSQSLLNIQAFTDPTAYKLKVKRPGSDESREVNVDLIETFNWLVGLTVRHFAAPQTLSASFERDSEKRLRVKRAIKQQDCGPYWFRTVTGTTPEGRKTLIIWRKLTGNPEEDNLVLDEWFKKQGYSSKDSEFDLIYVNGTNNLENLKTPEDTWKVRLIEEDFHRLMFEAEGA